ncbi:hypothetical protein E2562_012289 [Oryza meyeriana var. granulata]|uniref:Uncharacterized protein n=1 Tax=Oryza meyeriana var. granulata TaxID=110450 RepID=A0A6G1DGR1_9ORYZ|nr:hypothetical protein E2562_012289 [Oryza meyeriana var. granulata]
MVQPDRVAMNQSQIEANQSQTLSCVSLAFGGGLGSHDITILIDIYALIRFLRVTRSTISPSTTSSLAPDQSEALTTSICIALGVSP